MRKISSRAFIIVAVLLFIIAAYALVTHQVVLGVIELTFAVLAATSVAEAPSEDNIEANDT